MAMVPVTAPVSEMYNVFSSGEKAIPFGWINLSSTTLTAPVLGRKR